ncbi:MAG: ABC transporter substrate-binding protein [Thermodesulfovibrionales bacterium]|nr:ABC transporter substrate-binding protein [Thermodesulfovibrionales bacterium]
MSLIKKQTNLHNNIILLIFSITLCLNGCSSNDKLQGFLYIRLNSDITTLDPAFITDVSSAQVAAKIHRGLVRLSDDLKVIPDIAYKWDISKNQRIYTFTISNDVFFEDKRRVTAFDFEYSYRRIMDSKTGSPNRWVFERVESINAIDENTLQIILKTPFSPFLTMLTMPAGYVVDRNAVERLGANFSYNPSCTGRYCLKRWDPSREIVLETRALETKNQEPLGIVYKIIPEDITAVVEYEVANIDVLGIPASAFRYFMQKREKDVIRVSSLNTYYLGMNTERHPFNESRFRKAVALAIDRKKILQTFMNGRGRLADCIIPDELRHWTCVSDIQYDPQRSKLLLKSIGINTITITMYVTPEQDVVDLAEIIQQYLRRVGITLKIKQMEWTAFKESVIKGEADLFWLSWWVDYPHAENFLFPLFHSQNKGYGGNKTRFSNSEVDRLLDTLRTSINQNDTQILLNKVENIIMDELPMIPFWHKTDYIAVQQWIKGVKGYPIYNMDRAEGISILKH